MIEVGFVGLSEGAAGLVCWDDGANMALDIYPRAQGDEGKQSREQLPADQQKKPVMCCELTFSVILKHVFNHVDPQELAARRKHSMHIFSPSGLGCSLLHNWSAD